MQRILIVGATSAIAEAVARRYAARGARLHLLGRDSNRLRTIADDLQVRGAAQATYSVLDADALDAHADAIAASLAALGAIDVTLVAHGTLPDQTACDSDTSYAMREFITNGLSTISLCNHLVPVLAPSGSLAAISSVAGDRGRASNYLYGSAKAAVSTYLSGLRQRLGSDGINVLTIKPGFVDTPMTRAFKKGPLWAKPDAVAKSIVKAIDKRSSVAYVPGFWWLIMFIIRSIPEFVFRRVKL